MGTRGTMTFRIASDLREALRALARRERRSVAWMVEEAVRQMVERAEKAAREAGG